MAIVRAPLKTDTAGKCSRWRVILYNPATHKQEWHTIPGTKRNAETFERDQKQKLGKGTYVAKRERHTVAEAIKAFMAEQGLRGNRTSTLLSYRTVFDKHITPEEAGAFSLASRELGTLRVQDAHDLFNAMRAAGSTVHTVNRVAHTFKILLNFACDREWIDRNPLHALKPFKTAASPRVRRGAFEESEVRAILTAARPGELALIGLLCFTGMRPGEAYALRWSDLDLAGGSARIARSWDHRGKLFVEPKTHAGTRTVALSGWLVKALEAYRSDAEVDALVFSTRNDRPLNPSNVRRDVWAKLVTRAGVRSLDMYSLRHTFASLARTAGEGAFNVSRQLGHSKSTLVDAVYAHSLPSGLAGMSERVTARAFGTTPQLRLIDGGREVREPLKNTGKEGKEVALTG
jgi:integrase